MWPYGYGMGWGWMAANWIVMVVFWGLIIVGLVALCRAGMGRGVCGGSRNPETPLEILRRRYASGELTREQFENMKKDVA